MFGDKKNLTPIMWFLVALCGFEFFVRAPYMIWLVDNPYAPQSIRFQYFGIFEPWSVIGSGATITILATLVAFAAHSFASFEPIHRKYRNKLVGFGWQPLAAIPLLAVAAVVGIYLLGVQEISENISAKRDLDSLEMGVLVYLLLKIALFSHVIAALCYMAFLGSRKKKYLILLGISTVITVITSVIFSQRALLFTLGFEIIYATYLFRGIKLRQLLVYATPFAVILVGIGALRALGGGNVDFVDAVLIGFDKVMSSRYFFNLGKLGAVYQWQQATGPIDFLSLNFFIEPFNPDETVFFKDVGRIVSTEVFGLASSGVTLGLVSESILSFGLVFGILFCFVFFFTAFYFERRMLQGRQLNLVTFFVIAKVPILLNTSLGSFLYQAILETILLLMIIPGLRFVQLRTSKKPHMRRGSASGRSGYSAGGQPVAATGSGI